MRTEIKIAGTWRDPAFDRKQKRSRFLATKLLSKEDAEHIFNSKAFDRYNEEVKDVQSVRSN